MKLVVIESPGKRETLQKYLCKDYLVVSSKGHVRDLPIKSLGVDLIHNYITGHNYYFLFVARTFDSKKTSSLIQKEAKDSYRYF